MKHIVKSPPRRFFISYHRAEPDQGLAHALAEGIRKAGHEVFIDTDIPLGTDWTQEIALRIEWCELMVVLISEESHTSEMIQTEIRMAYERKQQAGKPEILPVRLRYLGPLDYELDSLLRRIQYTTWDSPEDSPRVLREILAATHDRRGYERPPAEKEENQSPEPPGERRDLRRPEPGVDPRIFSSPGGTMRLDDPFYITRDADAEVARRASLEGETLIIKAPRQMGKSSLLLRYFLACKKVDKKIAFLDFSNFSEMELKDYATLLLKIASFLALRMRPHDKERDSFRGKTQGDLTAFVEDLLSNVSGPVVFAIDEADRIMGKPFREDFLTMLRMWHNNRAYYQEWNKLDIALVISTEPVVWITDIHRSPFNVTVPVKLGTFEPEQCSDLNQRYGEPLKEREVASLHELLDGHPYLTRLAFYHLVTDRRLGTSTLIDGAADPDGVFGDHLRALLMKVARHEDLLSALRRIVRRGTDPGLEMYYRLKGFGVIRRERGRVVFANRLYADFFGNVL